MSNKLPLHIRMQFNALMTDAARNQEVELLRDWFEVKDKRRYLINLFWASDAVQREDVISKAYSTGWTDEDLLIGLEEWASRHIMRIVCASDAEDQNYDDVVDAAMDAYFDAGDLDDGGLDDDEE